MGKSTEGVFSKLDRPPAAPNWVRYNFGNVLKTAKAVAQFALGFPTISYQPGLIMARDRIELGITLDNARKAIAKIKNPAARDANAEFVRAFFAYDAQRQYSGKKSYDHFSGSFLVGRDIRVPVTPTSVILERGKLVPIFVCGWATNPLDLYQRRLLMTVVDDAFLSLTDFANAPAEFVFLPRNSDGNREPEVWQRGDYEMLTSRQLSEQVDVFMAARKLAYDIVREKLSTSVMQPATTAERPADVDQLALFD